MSIFSKILKFIKNIFLKKETPVLVPPQTVESSYENLKNKKPIFMEEYQKKMAKVETLVHDRQRSRNN